MSGKALVMAAFKFFSIFALLLAWPGQSLMAGGGERTLRFPGPPHATAIGTQVGPVNTQIQQVTLSPPVSVQRYGLHYTEVRGEIEGIGWGGTNDDGRLTSHYTYRLPYVLRIPPGRDCTLVVHRHGVAPIGFWVMLEENLGSRNFGRTFHETADRFVSDVALHPDRRWALFAVNQTPVDSSGGFNTRLVPDDPNQVGAPVHSMWDVPIGRDTAMLAKHLLKLMRGREPAITLGTGHSAGAFVNFMLNAGIDPLRGSDPILAGDNFIRPYDPSSGRIFDGFIWFSGGAPVPMAPVDPVRGVSAPTLFVAGEVDVLAERAVRQVKEGFIDQGLDAASWSRIYMVRNVPHVDADLVLILNRHGLEFADLFGLSRDFFGGGGERLKPLSAALLDALKNWVTAGIPPPVSIFNGEAVDTDSIRFPHSNGETTFSFPYVDDPVLDQLLGPPPTNTQNNIAFVDRWVAVRQALSAVTASIVLPETACRRGGFTMISQGPVGTWFVPFDQLTFLDAWGSSAAHQSCRVQSVDALASQGLYDPTVVTIDISPHEFPNIVDLSAPGRLRVAILSTAGFDATRVVPGSVRLAGASLGGVADHPGNIRARIEDVNGDGLPDLVVEFRVKRLSFVDHDQVAELWGWTQSGTRFSGADLVQLVLAD